MRQYTVAQLLELLIDSEFEVTSTSANEFLNWLQQREPPQQRVWMVEGIWSGYRAEQRKLNHRHYTTDAKQINWILTNKCIHFSDNTREDLIVIDVTETPTRQRAEPIASYKPLIKQCVRHDKNHVKDLPGDVTQ